MQLDSLPVSFHFSWGFWEQAMASKEELDEASRAKEKELRQKRIDTAVKFLQNPKVRQTPMSQRKAFLEKKGLKQGEIEEAIRLSGTSGDEHLTYPPPPVPERDTRKVPPSTQMLATSPPLVPWRSYVGAAILGGGIGYTAAHLIKTFILPYVYHKKSTEEVKLEKIETSVMELKGNMVETVQKSLDSVQNLLEQQQKKLHSLALDLASTQSKVALLPSESYTVGDLKGEILSLKGLLLNRKQFPSPMVGSTPGAPSIPSWQRTVTTSTERTRTTSSVTESETPGSVQSTELSDSKEQATSRVASLECNSINGDVSQRSNEVKPEGEIVQQQASEDSPIDRCSTSSSCGTDTGHTPKTVVSAGEMNLNDAMLNDASVLSSDTSLSTMSDMSGNASFNEASIAFSSTCIKVPPDAVFPSDSTVDFDEGGNDSGDVNVQ